MGKGKKRIFPGGEKRKSAGILPKKTRLFTCQKIKKPLFVENFRGEKSMSGGSSPPCPTEKNPMTMLLLANLCYSVSGFSITDRCPKTKADTYSMLQCCCCYEQFRSVLRSIKSPARVCSHLERSAVQPLVQLYQCQLLIECYRLHERSS